MLISVAVSADRLKYGTLSCGAFSCRCYCKADNGAADAAGNPTRDPRKRQGDTPTGKYAVTLGAICIPERSYGPNPVLHIVPTGGDGLVRAKAEGIPPALLGLMVHGGQLAEDGKSLRPTHGCIRLDDASMQTLDGMVAGASDLVTLEVTEADPQQIA